MDYPAFKYPALWRDGDDIRGYLPDPGPGPWFTAEQVRAIVQEAIAADRAQRAAPVSEAVPVAYRAWFDADNGARWLFTLWPEEEKLEVDWQPLYAAAQPVVEPTREMIVAGAKAAREYYERTGGNSPAVIYRAMAKIAQPVAREPLTKKQIFEIADGSFTASNNLTPQQCLHFARALEAAHSIGIKPTSAEGGAS